MLQPFTAAEPLGGAREGAELPVGNNAAPPNAPGGGALLAVGAGAGAGSKRFGGRTEAPLAEEVAAAGGATAWLVASCLNGSNSPSPSPTLGLRGAVLELG